MKNLLYKEFRLALHPTCLMFMALSAMMLIPNYPYCVNFFYTGLAIFFTCLSGRENNDIFYSLTLPVKKADIVRARMTVAVILQMVQVVLTIPFALLRNSFTDLPPNQAGMDANLALYGVALLLFGVFNLFFFTSYYKDVTAVGKTFAKSSVIFFVVMMIPEVCCFAVPFMRDYIDNTNPEYIPYRIPFLAVGIAAYAVLTFIAYKKSMKSFCKIDL